jgi:hypothetical protein
LFSTEYQLSKIVINVLAKLVDLVVEDFCSLEWVLELELGKGKELWLEGGLDESPGDLLLRFE